MAGKPDSHGKPRRRRVEPRELLRRRGVVFESEVLERLREGRPYVYRDGRGEPVAFYLDVELLQGTPWWAEDSRMEEIRRREQERGGAGAGASDARRELQELLDRLGG